MPLYVQAQGGRIGLSGERLTVATKEGTTEARLTGTSQVCVLGNVQVSMQALKALLDRGIPIGFFTTGGYYLGRACGYSSKNVELREKLRGMIHHTEDRVLFVDVGPAEGRGKAGIWSMGRTYVAPDVVAVVV